VIYVLLTSFFESTPLFWIILLFGCYLNRVVYGFTSLLAGFGQCSESFDNVGVEIGFSVIVDRGRLVTDGSSLV